MPEKISGYLRFLYGGKQNTPVKSRGILFMGIPGYGVHGVSGIGRIVHIAFPGVYTPRYKQGTLTESYYVLIVLWFVGIVLC